MEFTERMELGRDMAAARRHRGLSTGASAAGWDVKRPLQDCPIARAKVDWHMNKSAALEIYERAVFPDRFWSGPGIAPTIDDVIAARHEAERDALLATF